MFLRIIEINEIKSLIEPKKLREKNHIIKHAVKLLSKSISNRRAK